MTDQPKATEPAALSLRDYYEASQFPDPLFEQIVKDADPTLWAKADLAAVRLGWNLAGSVIAALHQRIGELSDYLGAANARTDAARAANRALAGYATHNRTCETNTSEPLDSRNSGSRKIGHCTCGLSEALRATQQEPPNA